MLHCYNHLPSVDLGMSYLRTLQGKSTDSMQYTYPHYHNHDHDHKVMLKSDRKTYI